MNRSAVFSWSIAGVLCMAGCASDPAASDNSSRNGANGSSGGSSASSNGNPGNSAAGSSSSNNNTSNSSTGGSSTSSSSSSGGSSASSSNAGSSSSAGSVDCSAMPLPSNMDDVIANFEEGTAATLQVGGRGGGFYVFNDGTGMQTPPAGGSLPDATKIMRCDSTYALCTSGKNFTTWGAGIGTDFGKVAAGADGGMGAKSTYDASMYKGVAFWAKSNGAASLPVRVSIKDKNTAPEGGKCDAKMTSGPTACNDDWGKAVTFTNEWKPVVVMFSDMRQAGWGQPFPEFDVKETYSMQLQVNKGIDFDLCIDDVVFLH